MNKKPTWHETFFKIADVISDRSDDPHTKVGSVIVDEKKRVVSIGYNGFPRHVKHKPERLDRESGVKYKYMTHSEQNSIMFADNDRRVGATLYVHFMPCSRCAQDIIQSGIVKVIIDKLRNDEYAANAGSRYIEDFDHVRQMFGEAEIQIVEYAR